MTPSVRKIVILLKFSRKENFAFPKGYTPLYFHFSIFTPYQIIFDVKSYNSNFFEHEPKIVFLRIILFFIAKNVHLTKQ